MTKIKNLRRVIVAVLVSLTILCGLTAVRLNKVNAITVPDGYTAINIEESYPVDGYGQPTLTVSESGNYYIYGTKTLSQNSIVIKGGVTATVILDDVNIAIKESIMQAAITVESGANLTIKLLGENTLMGGSHGAAINVPEGATLTVTSIDGDGKTAGKLTATARPIALVGTVGAVGLGGAGIGANGSVPASTKIPTLGNVLISGGTVIATGATGGAGIGGTNESSTGSITISGGRVEAYVDDTSEHASGAAIGGGASGYVPNVKITGGYVVAGETYHAAGIGGGWNGQIETDRIDYGNVSISGGTVIAKGSNQSGAVSIGRGGVYNTTATVIGSVTVTGGTILAEYGVTSPTDGENELSLKTIEFLEFEDGTEFEDISLSGGAPYGANGVTVQNGKIYLYLPTSSSVESVTFDGQIYPVRDIYTVSFSAGLGVGTMDSVRVYEGDYVLPKNGFTAEEGLYFVGWTYANEDYLPGKKIVISGDTVVTAKWTDAPEVFYGANADSLSNGATLEYIPTLIKDPLNQIGHIKLNAEVSIDQDFIMENGAFVFDLAGNTIKVDNSASIFAVDGANVKFIDSASGGKIKWSYRGLEVYGGNVTIDGGVYHAEEKALFVYKGATVTINGGTLVGEISNEGTLKMFGGSVQSNFDGISNNGELLVSGNVELNSNGVDLFILGGEVDFSNYTGDEFSVKFNTLSIAFILPNGYLFFDGTNSYKSTSNLNFTDEFTVTKTSRVVFLPNGGSGTMADDYALGVYELPTATFTAPENTFFFGWSYTLNGNPIEEESISITEETVLYAVWKSSNLAEAKWGASETGTLTEGKFLDAMDAVIGGTASYIRLLSDVEVDQKYRIDSTYLTIDFNGYFITASYNVNPFYLTGVGASLTLKDTNPNREGGIVADYSIVVNAYSGSVLNVNGGILKTDGRSVVYASSSTVNVTGGSIVREDEYSTAISLYANSKFNMSGGEVDAIYVSNSNVNVSGGTIYTRDSYLLWSYMSNDLASVKISGTTKLVGKNGPATFVIYSETADVVNPIDFREYVGDLSSVKIDNENRDFDRPIAACVLLPENYALYNVSSLVTGTTFLRNSAYSIALANPKDKYAVSFDANGGSGSIASKDVVFGTAYFLPQNSFTAPDGYEFGGWIVDGRIQQPKNGITVYKDTVIKPAWNRLPHEHKFTYTATGTTITAVCTAVHCPLENGYAGSITLTAPLNLIYDGSVKQAIINYDAWQGDTPKIVYQKDGKTVDLPVNAGDYTASVTIDGNTVSISFTIEKAQFSTEGLIVVPHDPLIYDGQEKQTVVTSPIVDDDFISVSYYDEDGNPVLPVNAGVYTVKVTVAESDNYKALDTLYEVGTFTIEKAKAPQIVWATASDLIYGQKLLESVITSIDEHGVFMWQNGEVLPTVNNGGYAVVYTPNDLTNYDYTEVELTKIISVSVNKKTVTVTANDAFVCVGGTYSLTYTVEGLVGDDTLIQQPTLSTLADVNVLGVYDITAYNATASENYTVVYTGGTLTVRDHSYSGVVTLDPTCVSVGEKTYYCDHDSSHFYTEEIPIDENAHTWNKDGVCTGCNAIRPKDGLSGGAIAGIVIGATLVVGFGGFAIFWFVIKKKNRGL